MRDITNQIKAIMDIKGNKILELEDCVRFIKTVCGVGGDKTPWQDLEQEEIYFRMGEAGIKFEQEDYDLFLNKMNALKAFLKNDAFYLDIDAFQNIVLALNEEVVEPEEHQDIDLVDILFAFKELESVTDFDPNFLSHEVKAYIASEAKEEGFVLLPEKLDCCQELLDKINYHLPLLSFKQAIRDRMDADIEELDEDGMVDAQVLKIKRVELSAQIRKVVEDQ